MANWFYASEGKQQGPCSESQFRDLIAQGVVRSDTLVWSEGMAGWQKAGETAGLMSAGGGPPVIPTTGRPPAMASGGHGGGPLSIEFGIWDFVWRSIVLLIGCFLVIPAPWAFVWYTKWIISCLQVPGRPNISFTGNAMTLVPWYFGALVLAIAVAMSGIQWLNNLMFLVQLALYWLLLKWMVANVASDGQPLGLSFSGTFWAYLGWSILLAVSVITIIGWAWVSVAQIRWFCRNVQGTRREIVFKATGLEFLWRALVAAIASAFIIPIPWVYRWMMGWMASETFLVERNSQAGL